MSLQPGKTDRLVETHDDKKEAEAAASELRSCLVRLTLTDRYGLFVAWVPTARAYGIYVGEHDRTQ